MKDNIKIDVQCPSCNNHFHIEKYPIHEIKPSKSIEEKKCPICKKRLRVEVYNNYYELTPEKNENE